MLPQTEWNNRSALIGRRIVDAGGYLVCAYSEIGSLSQCACSDKAGLPFALPIRFDPASLYQSCAAASKRHFDVAIGDRPFALLLSRQPASYEEPP